MNNLKTRWESLPKDYRVTIKVIVGTAVLVLIWVTGDALFSSVPKMNLATDDPAKKYTIEMIEPEKVILIRAKMPSVGYQTDCTLGLSDGLKTIGKSYRILAITPIISQVAEGSATTSLIVLVEPKPN